MFISEIEEYASIVKKSAFTKTVASGIILSTLLFVATAIVLTIIGVGSNINERLLDAFLIAALPVLVIAIAYAPFYSKKVYNIARGFGRLVLEIVNTMSIDRGGVELVEVTPPPLIAVMKYMGKYIVFQKNSLSQGGRIYVIVVDPIEIEEHEGYSPTYHIRMVDKFVPKTVGKKIVSLNKAEVLFPEPGEDKVLYIVGHIASVIAKPDIKELVEATDIAIGVIGKAKEST